MRKPPAEPLRHNILLSWAGLRSKAVAVALHDWLPMVLQAAKPWFSDRDIPAGAQWFAEIEARLQWCKVAVIPLTPEAMVSQWLNFEAGAVFKAVRQTSRVCVLLLDGLRPADVTGPLGQLHHTQPTKDGVRKMVLDIRKAIGADVEERVVVELVDRVWDKLEPVLKTPKDTAKPRPRSDRELLEEILQHVRLDDSQKREEFIDLVFTSALERIGRSQGLVEAPTARSPIQERGADYAHDVEDHDPDQTGGERQGQDPDEGS